MKTKVSILALALMLLCTFAFAGGEKEKGGATAATGELGEPQYGGTATLFISNRHAQDPPGPDMKDANRDSFHWLDFVLHVH